MLKLFLLVPSCRGGHGLVMPGLMDVCSRNRTALSPANSLHQPIRFNMPDPGQAHLLRMIIPHRQCIKQRMMKDLASILELSSSAKIECCSSSSLSQL